jgi:chromosome segregation ATPase
LCDNLKIKEAIFAENQAYQTGLLDELKALNTDQLRLQKECRAFEEAAKQSEYLVKRIEETKDEKERLQKEFENVTRQPFFKRESDQTVFKKISELQTKIEEKDRNIKVTKDSIVRLTESIRSLNEEQKDIKRELESYNDEVGKLRTHYDPNALSLQDIQKRIHEIDPSMFRQVMEDLRYNGEEPLWAKLKFMESLKIDKEPIDENDPRQLKIKINELMNERRELVTAKETVENQLKLQVSIDKESAHLYQVEIDTIKARIAQDNRRIVELNQQITAKNHRLLAITKQTQH